DRPSVPGAPDPRRRAVGPDRPGVLRRSPPVRAAGGRQPGRAHHAAAGRGRAAAGARAGPRRGRGAHRPGAAAAVEAM
ncbi:MAG: Phage tail fiber protein, partial [uncultured Gemmatimonadetes bacterium]